MSPAARRERVTARTSRLTGPPVLQRRARFWSLSGRFSSQRILLCRWGDLPCRWLLSRRERSCLGASPSPDRFPLRRRSVSPRVVHGDLPPPQGVVGRFGQKPLPDGARVHHLLARPGASSQVE